MWEKTVLKLTKWFLRNSTFSDASRAVLTAEVLDTLAVIPLNDILEITKEGSLVINKKPVDVETALRLRESAKAVVHSVAYQLIYQQVTYQAFLLGAHKVETERQMLFSRAALYWGQQERKLLEVLAQEDSNSSIMEI